MSVGTTKCDICGCKYLQYNLFNFAPEINANVDDVKEEFKDFEGMMCPNCYYEKAVTDEFLKEIR